MLSHISDQIAEAEEEHRAASAEEAPRVASAASGNPAAEEAPAPTSAIDVRIGSTAMLQDDPAPSAIDVRIGSTAMLQDDPALVEKIATMVNTAYFEGMRELLPEGATEYERVSCEDVLNRLEMGDDGPRANRVLHLAFRDGSLVGCASSTFQPPWTPDGCGHWGLLVVDLAAQGSGVASAIVTAAEARLAGMCALVQIEYDYTPGHGPSEKLKAMYENKYGFECVASHRRRGAEFRKCFKELPRQLRLAQRPVHLRAVHQAFATEVRAVSAAQPGGIDLIGEERRVVGLKDEGPALNGRRGSLLWFDSEAGRYIVRLESAGKGASKAAKKTKVEGEGEGKGRDADADADAAAAADDDDDDDDDDNDDNEEEDEGEGEAEMYTLLPEHLEEEAAS